MSTPAARMFQWRGGELVPTITDEGEAVRLLAADSWLTVDGSTRGLELHRQRFTAAVEAQLGTRTPPALADGSGAPQLRARMRPAPPTRTSIALMTHTGEDPRTRPEIKGPDLGAMLDLRGAAEAAGADEAVLLVDGQVVEGATTALLWWNGDTLVTVPNWMPRVSSVTELSIRALATAFGTEVVEYLARPEELDHKEIWAVNALHGIRIVTSWIDGPIPAAEPGRHDRWRRSLDALRRPAT
mgnify:CR=1 FL=1